MKTNGNDFVDLKGNGSGADPYKGLTKREYFAALAMQSMEKKDHGDYSEREMEEKKHLTHPRWVADAAVDYADALITALNANKEK